MPLVNRERGLSHKTAASSGHSSEMVPLPSRACKERQSYCLLCLCRHARNPSCRVATERWAERAQSPGVRRFPHPTAAALPRPHLPISGRGTKLTVPPTALPQVSALTPMLADIFHVCFTSVQSCASLTPTQHGDVLSIFKD